MRRSGWLRSAAIGTWAVCGLPSAALLFRTHAAAGIAAAWSAAFLGYGAALVVAIRRHESPRRPSLVLVALQSATAVALAALGGRYLTSSGVGLLADVGLLVIVASQLPHYLRTRWASVWIGVQTAVVAVIIAPGFPLPEIITFAVGTAGFQVFAALTTALMLREAAARVDLARLNAELQATRALLAEHSRAAERLRIARDLHDALGHHLTALSLRLDVATRLADARSAPDVAQAHAITRLLLAEVRSVVGELRDGGQADVAQAIRMLAASVDEPQIHVDVPDRLTIDDAERAHALLRSVQEIITNASRHANARNLWLSVRRASGGIELSARDDGRGAEVIACGHGLTGMRERFAECSGRIEFEARAGQGFSVVGFLPIPEAAS